MIIIITIVGQYVIFRISQNNFLGPSVQIQSVDANVTILPNVLPYVKIVFGTLVTYLFAEKILEETVTGVGKYAPVKNLCKIPPGIFNNQGCMAPPDKNFIGGTVYCYFELEIVYINLALTIYRHTDKGK
jgi:hypothetical protein